MNKVFFSWQTDNLEFKSFLLDCIRTAINDLDSYELLTIAKRQQGAQDISDRILEVIRSCDVFIADISIVGEYPFVDSHGETRMRKTANPNVLYETGYAMKTLGHERIMLFASSSTTRETNDLPFDVRNRSVMIRDFNPTNKQSVINEIKRILNDLNSPLAREHPMIFCTGIGWSRASDNTQMNFTLQNEEPLSYTLESVEIGENVMHANQIINMATMTQIHVVGATLPPYDTPVEFIKFKVSRLQDKYTITQRLRISERADGAYNLDGVHPLPETIHRN